MGQVKIGNLSASPGQTVSGYVKVTTAADGNNISIPTVIINGKRDGPLLLVDALTHGDEFEGGLSALKLIKAVSPAALTGTLVVVPVLHAKAFEAGVRGNPLERHHYDLNRSYPGKSDGTITQMLAHFYFNEYVKKAKYSISFHGGGEVFYLDPFVIAENEKSMELVKGMAWDHYTFSPDIANTGEYRNTLHQLCADNGIASITCEHGGGINRTPEWLEQVEQRFVGGALNVMKRMQMLEGEPARPKISMIKKINLRARNGGFIIYQKGFRLKASVKKGDHLMSIVDPIGNELERIDAPMDGTVMGLPGDPVAWPGAILGSVFIVEKTIQT